MRPFVVFAAACSTVPRAAIPELPKTRLPWEIANTDTELRMIAPDPWQIAVTVIKGTRKGEITIHANVDADEDDEFGLGWEGMFNHDLESFTTQMCKRDDQMTEFRTVRLYTREQMRAWSEEHGFSGQPTDPESLRRWTELHATAPPIPLIAIDRGDDGNVRIVIDADLDGRAEADQTTTFDLGHLSRSASCR